MPEKKLLRVSCAARAITRPTTPTPATKTPNSTLKVDKKFVRPNTIIRIDYIISREGHTAYLIYLCLSNQTLREQCNYCKCVKQRQ